MDDKISAYYSLAFPHFTYYLQTLTVTIGRRLTPSATSSEVSLVDVDLGPLKSVSRLHARIEYEEEEERFVLVVLGRNGAWVDGIWAGSGSKVPLGARSQIQIATRTFHFILPPPPEPETTSLSPPPSTARHRSPSVDITSLSAGSSHPTSPQPTPLSLLVAENLAPSEPKPAKSAKKRKRPEADQPLPENMPPKPSVTYAVMCYRAITSLGGKATLQDVVQWMIDNYEWYKYNIGGPWENSVRHNLSSNRAFRKVAKLPDERGKGFMWGIDPKFEPGLRDQDAKTKQAELSRQRTAVVSGRTSPMSKSQRSPPKPVFTKEPLTKLGIMKDKIPVENSPTLTKSPEFSVNGLVSSHTLASVSVSPTKSLTIGSPHSSVPSTSTTLPLSSTNTSPSVSSPCIPSSSASSSVPQIPPNVSLPIVVAPLPETHHAASASAAALASSASPASAILTAPPIVLHSGTLILNPTIFSHLTSQQLKELEGLGAQKALEILQGHIVRFLKEKMRSEGGNRGPGRGRGRGRGGTSGRVRPRKDDKLSSSDAGASMTPTVGELCQKGSAETNPPPTAEPLGTNKLSRQSSSWNRGTDIDEPVVKKRKMDTDVHESMDTEVDVVGA